MATRSAITIYDDSTDTYKGIYCHLDGYPDGVGEMLRKNYTSKEQVEALMELGDLSSLGSNLQNTVAYARDRGEEKVPPVVGKTFDRIRKEIDHEYAYLFKDGKWHVIRAARKRK